MKGDVLRISSRLRSWVPSCMLAIMLLAGCGEPSTWPTSRPTPRSTLPVVPPAKSTVDISESSCVVDEDCIFAFRLDRCCDCGAIYSRRYVDAEPRLLLYQERWDYGYPVPRITPADCSGVQCAPCPCPPLGPICADGTCRAPEAWDEVSRVCARTADQQARNNCYTQAATYAYLQVGLDKSLALCDLVQGELFEGIPARDECRSTIGMTVLSKDPDRAAAFCLDHLQQSRSRCLKEAGETIAVRDIDGGLAICEAIVAVTDDDRFQRDACFHNIAMQVRETDVARAREICERMAERVDDCKESAGQKED